MIDYGFYDEMTGISHNPYPLYIADRGQVDASPFVEQFYEVQTDPRIGRAKQNHNVVDPHRIEGEHIPVGRVLGHPSRIVAPVLIDSNQPQTFDVPHYITAWAPNPIVQHTFGQNTLAVDDMRHTVPKQLLSYSYDALSQQEIADQAALAVRRAMYGR